MVSVAVIAFCSVDGVGFIAAREHVPMQAVPAERSSIELLTGAGAADLLEVRVAHVRHTLTGETRVLCGPVELTLQELAALERAGFEVSADPDGVARAAAGLSCGA